MCCNSRSFTMADLFRDLLDAFGPDKGLGVLVVVADVTLNGLDQVLDAGEAASPNPLARDFTKPSFGQIQPGRTRRCEVQVETRVSLEPRLHFGVFVGGVVT